eukprot:gene17510-biopygen7666
MPLAAKRGGTAAWRQSESLGGKAGNDSRAAPMLACTFLPIQTSSVSTVGPSSSDQFSQFRSVQFSQSVQLLPGALGPFSSDQFCQFSQSVQFSSAVARRAGAVQFRSVQSVQSKRQSWWQSWWQSWRHSGKALAAKHGGVAAKRGGVAARLHGGKAWRHGGKAWRHGGMAALVPLAAQLAASRGGTAAKLAASMPLVAKRGGMAAWWQRQLSESCVVVLSRPTLWKTWFPQICGRFDSISWYRSITPIVKQVNLEIFMGEEVPDADSIEVPNFTKIVCSRSNK